MDTRLSSGRKEARAGVPAGQIQKAEAAGPVHSTDQMETPSPSPTRGLVC